MTINTYADAVKWMEERLEANPVQCDGCTACCRNRQGVMLDEEVDDPGLYAPEHLEPAIYNGKLGLKLKFRPNGDCIFLRGGKCKIYDKRPAVCRAFDCRRATSSFSLDEREMAIKRNVFPREVFEEADKRRHTLMMDPLEELFYAQAYDNLK